MIVKHIIITIIFMSAPGVTGIPPTDTDITEKKLSREGLEVIINKNRIVNTG
jgi:hypothetical protein